MVSGGAGGTRTPYLFNAIEALSQMSYSPKPSTRRGRRLQGNIAKALGSGKVATPGRQALPPKMRLRTRWHALAAPRCAAAEVPYPLALARLRPSAV